MSRVLMTVALVGLLGACSGGVKEDGAPVEDRKPDAVKPPTMRPTPPRAVPPAPTVRSIESSASTRNPLNDPGNILSQRSVYFDYDSTTVKDEFKPLVTAHAKYLTTNRGRKIVIQGNADERGSREYNLALGQRRADSVKKMLLLLGVRDSQIETVSFGEEKPRALGTDEGSYAENRRSDIVYDSE